MPRLSRIVRYLWAAPTTAIGAIVVLAGLRGASLRIVDGVLEAHGPTVAWMLRNLTLMPGGAAALTLGHVVIGLDAASLESTRAHERVHVRQCEAWGPLFVPAYLAASLVAAARGGNFYYDNRFEAEACAGGGPKDLLQADGVRLTTGAVDPLPPGRPLVWFRPRAAVARSERCGRYPG